MKPYSIAKIIWLYIKHYIQSGNEHSIHSPFVFKFYTQVIKAARKKDPRFAPISSFARKLTQNKTQLSFQDPSTNQSKVQSIGYIAKTAAKPALLGRVLGLSFDYFKPAVALELGTSLGISALYQTALYQPEKFISIEGNPQLNELALQNIDSFNRTSIQLKLGYFSDVLTKLEELNKIEWVFIDGDHQFTPTLFYFDYLIEQLPENAVLIFDDINWSPDMQRAWQQIIRHKKVTIALDFFFLGFVFINPIYTKQTFKLRL